MDELVFDPTTNEGQFALSIAEGIFSFASGQIAKSGINDMAISTPVVTIGIRGTTGAGRAGPEGTPNTVSLLPDASGQIGEITVSTAGGSVTLNVPGATAQALNSIAALPAPVILNPTQINQRYGAAINTLPPPVVAPQQNNQSGPSDDSAALEENAESEGETADAEDGGGNDSEGEEGQAEEGPEGEAEGSVEDTETAGSAGGDEGGNPADDSGTGGNLAGSGDLDGGNLLGANVVGTPFGDQTTLGQVGGLGNVLEFQPFNFFVGPDDPTILGPQNPAANIFGIPLASLNGSNGFRLDGVAAVDISGRSVSSAGDINGDGFDDIIIGAPQFFGGSGTGNGAAFVVFGSSSGFSASLDLSTLDGTTGFRVNGVTANSRTGQIISSAGDINGDGLADLAIGAPSAASGGSTYVVFGKTSAFSATLDLSTLDGSTGFALNAVSGGDSLGVVEAPVDINGDGYDDLIVGAGGNAGGGGGNSGSTYVVFGKSSGFSASLSTTSLDGTTGFRLDGVATQDSAARASGAGDVNGDGFEDIV